MTPPDVFEENLFEKICGCFFEDYLMDEYCNKILRLLSIEHLHNGEMQKIYEALAFLRSFDRRMQTNISGKRISTRK